MKRTIERRRSGGGGFTLVEVVIAASIMTLVVTVSTSTFIFALRSAKSESTNLNMAEQSLKLQRLLKAKVTSAQKFVINGTTLNLTNNDGTVSQLVYRDADSNPDTINNNELDWDPNIATSGGEEVLMKNISPLDNNPIFEQPSNTSALHIRLRLGDRAVGNTAQNAITGVGFQTYVVDSEFMPRNSVN